jgi:hypothetical protein
MFIILISNRQSTFYRNCYQERNWLFKIRIEDLKKYVGVVTDVCGSDGDMNFCCNATHDKIRKYLNTSKVSFRIWKLAACEKTRRASHLVQHLPLYVTGL